MRSSFSVISLSFSAFSGVPGLRETRFFSLTPSQECSQRSMTDHRPQEFFLLVVEFFARLVEVLECLLLPKDQLPVRLLQRIFHFLFFLEAINERHGISHALPFYHEGALEGGEFVEQFAILFAKSAHLPRHLSQLRHFVVQAHLVQEHQHEKLKLRK